jgi:hypothetical protein
MLADTLQQVHEVVVRIDVVQPAGRQSVKLSVFEPAVRSLSRKFN